MKNINLLKDTKQPEDTLNGKRTVAGGFDLSSPERYEFKEKEGKASSGGSSWFSRIFTPTPKKKKEAKKSKSTSDLNAPKIDYVRAEQNVVDRARPLVTARPAYQQQQNKPLPEPARPPRPHFTLPPDMSVPTVRPSVSRVASPVMPSSPPPPPPLPPLPPLPPRANHLSGPSPVSFDVNLLPEDLVDQYEPRKKLVNFAVITGLTIVGLAALYVSMIFYQTSIVTKTEAVRAEAATINQEISSYQAQRTAALALKDKVDAITQRLDQHIYWTKFFTLLEKYTVSDVYYSNVFAGDINGELSLDATGKDYSSVARQLLAFQQASEFVESVVINSATRSTATEGAVAGVTFSVQIKLAEDVFGKPEEGASQ